MSAVSPLISSVSGACRAVDESCYIYQCCVQVVDNFSSRGLLALAVGILPNLAALDLPRMSQQQLEKHCSQIDLLALVVLTKHVRPDSKDTVAQLQQGYSPAPA